MREKGKRILISGASSGIGQSIYERYLNLWGTVIGVSRRGPDLRLDLSRKDSLSRLLTNRVFQSASPFDVLILNAGVMPLLDHPQEEVYRLNLEFNWSLLHSLGSPGNDIVNSGGAVILIASVSGVVGDEELTFYSCMKAALINLCKSYAMKLASARIRVNCISPGFVKTDLVSGDTPEFLLDRVPLGKREADPKELLPIVDALIGCSYITGQNIIVDGGLSL